MFSFPRSGSTLLRKYIELTTGVSTGSTLSINDVLVEDLFLKGFISEEHSNNENVFAI